MCVSFWTKCEKSLNKLIEKLCPDLPQKLLQKALPSVIVIYSPSRQLSSVSQWLLWLHSVSKLAKFGKGNNFTCIVEVSAKWSCGPFNQSMLLPIFIYQVSAIKDLGKKGPKLGPTPGALFWGEATLCVPVTRFRHISHFVAKSIKPEMHVGPKVTERVCGTRAAAGGRHPASA